MTISDWIMLLSAAIVALGWFVTGSFDRKNEIAKEQRVHRLEMLHCFFPILFFIKDEKKMKIKTSEDTAKLCNLLSTARTKFLLYGLPDEIVAFEKLVLAVEQGKNEDVVISLNTVANLARDRIRVELNLPHYTLTKK